MNVRSTIVPIVVLIAFVSAGAWFISRPRPVSSDENFASQDQHSSAKPFVTTPDPATSLQPNHRSGQNADALLSELSQLARKQPNLGRTQSIKNNLSELVQISPEAAITFLGNLSSDPLYSEFCRHLTMEWVRSDKQSAVDYFADLTNRNQRRGAAFLPYVFEALFQLKNPGYSDLSTLVSRLGRTTYVMELFNNEAYGHLVEEPDSLNELVRISGDDPESRKKLYSGAGTGLAMNQGFGALAGFDLSNLSPDRSAMLQSICVLLARAKPEEVTRWLNEHSTASELDAIRRATGKLLLQSRDPERSCKVVAGITDESLRGTEIVDPLIAWLNRDFDAAYKWALESTVHEDAIANSISRVEKTILSTSNDKFENAITLNPNTADLSVLSRKQFGIFVNWSNIDPLAARDWLIRSALSPEEKAKLFPITKR